MRLWRGVCLSCRKGTLICLMLYTCLKFTLYLVLNEDFNIVISKLQGVCHTQSCDPLRSLEVIQRMSNTVVWKLWGVYRTQSCDPPRGLDII
jgi:hypothetical protein